MVKNCGQKIVIFLKAGRKHLISEKKRPKVEIESMLWVIFVVRVTGIEPAA
jgi:hypothetical protein